MRWLKWLSLVSLSLFSACTEIGPIGTQSPQITAAFAMPADFESSDLKSDSVVMSPDFASLPKMEVSATLAASDMAGLSPLGSDALSKITAIQTKQSVYSSGMSLLPFMNRGQPVSPPLIVLGESGSICGLKSFSCAVNYLASYQENPTAGFGTDAPDAGDNYLCTSQNSSGQFSGSDVLRYSCSEESNAAVYWLRDNQKNFLLAGKGALPNGYAAYCAGNCYQEAFTLSDFTIYAANDALDANGVPTPNPVRSELSQKTFLASQLPWRTTAQGSPTRHFVETRLATLVHNAFGPDGSSVVSSKSGNFSENLEFFDVQGQSADVIKHYLLDWSNSANWAVKLAFYRFEWPSVGQAFSLNGSGQNPAADLSDSVSISSLPLAPGSSKSLADLISLMGGAGADEAASLGPVSSLVQNFLNSFLH